MMTFKALCRHLLPRMFAASHFGQLCTTRCCCHSRASPMIACDPTMVSTPPWFLTRLLTPLGECRLQALLDTVLLISQHPTLATAVADISRTDRKNFKSLSNTGCIYCRRKAIDMGNYRYCMLFHDCAEQPVGKNSSASSSAEKQSLRACKR